METLGEYELINPNDLAALFKANPPEPHMPGISTSAPFGMKMKYANIKKHAKAKGHAINFEDDDE